MFGALAPSATARAAGSGLSFVNYPAPAEVGFYTRDLAGTRGPDFAGETSIGVYPRTDDVLFQLDLTTARVHFDDSRVPASASWRNVSPPLNSFFTEDAILWTDSVSGRTFVAHDYLAGTSNIAFTDDGGVSWQEAVPPETAPSFDHETVGGGPYAAAHRLTAQGPRAYYYCAQLGSTDYLPGVSQRRSLSECVRSDDGGLTWGVPVPMDFNDTPCQSFHGHIVVGGDGAVYVPHHDCGRWQGVMMSLDNGASWQARPVPGVKSAPSRPFAQATSPYDPGDPAMAVDRNGRVYFASASAGAPVVASSTDDGRSWTTPANVAGAFSIRNIMFPMATAGDAGRAAVAFYGSSDPGNAQDPSFHGVWHVYVAVTLDSGRSWQTTDITPAPVQRGWICIAGTSCSGGRNLLDFQDMTIDRDGRILVGYADGCTSAKCTGPNGTPSDSTDSHGVIARQVSGPRLLGPPPISPGRANLERLAVRRCRSRRHAVTHRRSRRSATTHIDRRRVSPCARRQRHKRHHHP